MAIKGFRTFLKELSLTRVWQHTTDLTRPSGIISAFNANRTLEDNMARTARLASDIRSAGYGFSFIDGHYKYADGTAVAERSIFIVGNEKDNGKLKGLLKKWMTEYDQEAVLLKPENSNEAVLLTPGNGVKELGTFHPNRAGDFYSTMMNRPGTFVFESAYEDKNWLERLSESRGTKST